MRTIELRSMFLGENVPGDILTAFLRFCNQCLLCGIDVLFYFSGTVVCIEDGVEGGPVVLGMIKFGRTKMGHWLINQVVLAPDILHNGLSYRILNSLLDVIIDRRNACPRSNGDISVLIKLDEVSQVQPLVFGWIVYMRNDGILEDFLSGCLIFRSPEIVPTIALFRERSAMSY